MTTEMFRQRSDLLSALDEIAGLNGIPSTLINQGHWPEDEALRSFAAAAHTPAERILAAEYTALLIDDADVLDLGRMLCRLGNELQNSF